MGGLVSPRKQAIKDDKGNEVEGTVEDAIEINYDCSPLLSDANTRNAIKGALNVTESDLELNKRVTLRTFWKATFQPFYPAVMLDGKLGKNRLFADSFPNLDRLPHNYREEPLSSLDTLLMEMSQQSKDEIEILGAKLSSELVPLFGVPILAFLMLQFSAVAFYVSSNVERLEVDEASQWSFLLNGRSFLLFGLGTILVLPTGASILSFFLVTGETLLPKWSNLLILIFAVLCAAAAFFSYCVLRSRVLRNPGVRGARATP